MSFNDKLVNELDELDAAVNAKIKLVEDAFQKLEIDANNFEVKRRGIVKEGTRTVVKILQEKEKAVVRAMQADKLTYFVSLDDIEQRITEKVAEVEQSDEVNDIEFKAWLDNIKYEIDEIDSDLFKLEINIHPELMAEGLEELRNLLKPSRTEEKKSEESIQFVDKMSNELNNHYDHQEILHMYF